MSDFIPAHSTRSNYPCCSLVCENVHSVLLASSEAFSVSTKPREAIEINANWTLTCAGRSGQTRRERMVLGLYVAVAFLYGFSFLPSFAFFRAFETLLVLMFFWVAFLHAPTRNWRPVITHDPIFRLTLLWLTVLLALQIWYAYSLPEGIEASSKVTRHYLKPVLVLMLAYSLVLGGRFTPWLFLITAAAGILCYQLILVDPAHWSAAWQGQRVDFDIINAQHAGMICGTLLMGVVTFGPRVFAHLGGTPRLLAVTALALLFGLSLLAVLASQSRAIWLGLALALLVALLMIPLLRQSRPSSGKWHLRTLGVTSVAIALAAAVAILAFDADDRIAKRIASEQISIAELASAADITANGDPTTSITIRVASWSAAFLWFKERPLLGWGGGATKDLIQQSDFFSDNFKQRFGHLHNSFVESLVAHGIVGSLLMASLVVWVGCATFIGLKRKTMPVDVFIFAWAFFFFWLAINAFESYSLYPTGQYVNATVVGFIYSFYLRSELRRHTHD